MRFGIREVVFLLVLLAVPVASFIYVFQPRNAEITQAKDEMSLKRSRLDALDAMVAEIDDIGAAIEEGRRSIELIEAKLPSEQDVEGILEQVWQLAKRNRLGVKSVKSEKAVPAATYMELPLKMIVEGDFDGFYQFLLELESLPRITRIHQMKMERMTAMSGPNTDGLPRGAMKAEFTLSIYFESAGSASP